MVFKPSSTFREKTVSDRAGSGDSVFRFFLGLAVLICLWSTVVGPQMPAIGAWLDRLVSVFGGR